MDFLNARHEKIKDRTWNMERLVISNFFKCSIDNKWAKENPVSKIPTKKLLMPHIEHLNEEEATKLLEYLKNVEYKVPYYELIATILYTGMRVNEAIHLTKRDVDMEKWLLVIQDKMIDGQLWKPKTKERRYVPIPDEIKEIIREQMRTGGLLLFQNTKGKPLRDRKVLERLKTSCKKAGVKDVHVHSLRHSFTSIATEKGISAEVIQEVLGHRSDTMTRRYRHMSPDFLSKEFEKFKYSKKDGENG